MALHRSRISDPRSPCFQLIWMICIRNFGPQSVKSFAISDLQDAFGREMFFIRFYGIVRWWNRLRSQVSIWGPEVSPPILWPYYERKYRNIWLRKSFRENFLDWVRQLNHSCQSVDSIVKGPLRTFCQRGLWVGERPRVLSNLRWTSIRRESARLCWTWDIFLCMFFSLKKRSIVCLTWCPIWYRSPWRLGLLGLFNGGTPYPASWDRHKSSHSWTSAYQISTI